jgi:ankyrin repeat protein
LLDKHNAHSFNERFNGYPIHLAAKKGHCDLVRTLLSHTTNPADPTVLTRSSETAIIVVVREAAERASQGWKYVEHYVKHAALNCIKILAEYGCDLHARDAAGLKFTAVHLAAINGLWHIVKFLLEKNVNIDITIGTTTARKLIQDHEPLWVENYIGCDTTGLDSRDGLVTFLQNLRYSVDAKEQFFHDWIKNSDEDLRVNENYMGR